jgi:putative oxidoreductase
MLVFRVVVGLIVFAHGSQKLFGWFGGGGIGGTAKVMESYGMRSGRASAIAAGLGEAGGGVLMALGLATPLACAAVAASMLTAAVVTMPKGFWARDGGFEYPMLLAISAIVIAANGAGLISLDDVLGIEESGLAVGAVCGAVAALAAGVTLTLGRRSSR